MLDHSCQVIVYRITKCGRKRLTLGKTKFLSAGNNLVINKSSHHNIDRNWGYARVKAATAILYTGNM